jgi:hypothetical protein
MTVAYAPADHAPSLDGRIAPGHITRPVSAGGCGVCHEIQVDERGHAFLDCDQCAPALVGGHWGWAATPGGVPLTPDELAERELAERDAHAGQNAMMRAMTDSFVQAVNGGGFQFPGLTAAPAPQKSLVEQIAEMSAADKAALAAMLAPPVTVTVAEADEPTAPAEPPAPPTTSRVAASSAGTKRAPGRPRKTT